MTQGDLYFLKKWIHNNISIDKNMKFEQIFSQLQWQYLLVSLNTITKY